MRFVPYIIYLLAIACFRTLLIDLTAIGRAQILFTALVVLMVTLGKAYLRRSGSPGSPASYMTLPIRHTWASYACPGHTVDRHLVCQRTPEPRFDKSLMSC